MQEKKWVFSYYLEEKKRILIQKKNQFQNRDRKDAKESKQAKVQQQSTVESDGKSDSGSEIDATSPPNDGKNHVEFTEEEIIAPETNTVQFKVNYQSK